MRRALFAMAVVVAIGTVYLVTVKHSDQQSGAHASEWVLGRLGGPPPLAVEPAQSSEKLKLGASTRTAVKATIGADGFQVAANPGATQLMFSFGVRGTESADVAFLIAASDRDRWRTIFVEKLKPGAGLWIDRTVDLSTLDPPPERLRFQVAAPKTGTTDVEAYWGSIALLGHRPSRSWLFFWRKPAPPPVNVILVSLDTLGADHLSSFGNIPQVSPHLDEALARSFSFRRAYAQYPNTPVSHASIFTGLYPRRHGLYETNPQLHSETLANVLAARGYATVAITEDAYVSSDFGFDHGFDWYDNGVSKTVDADDKTLGNASDTFAKAREWLATYADDTPFFLFVHTYEVHAPYTPRDAEAQALTQAIDPGYQGPFEKSYPCGLWELAHNTGVRPVPQRDLDHLPALYAAEINYLDRLVDAFLTYLSGLPIAGRTLVVLTADHGEEFGAHGKLGHGETLYNHALHVPLGFLWPAKIKPGRSDTPVQLVDLMPTILDLIGIAVPPNLDGASLAQAILGRAQDVPRRPVFSELHTAFGDCRRLHLRDQCLVDRTAVQTDRFKFMTSKIPEFEMLYDLVSDPGETRDVLAQHPVEAAALRALVRQYGSAGSSGVFTPGTTPQMDDVTREQLRALGYVQ